MSHGKSWCHTVSCSIIEYLSVSSGILQDQPVSHSNNWCHTVSCSIIEYLWVADRIKISKLTIFGTNYTSDSNSLVICNSSAASHHQMKLRIFKAHWSQLTKTYVSWYLHLCSSKINISPESPCNQSRPTVRAAHLDRRKLSCIINPKLFNHVQLKLLLLLPIYLSISCFNLHHQKFHLTEMASSMLNSSSSLANVTPGME